MTIPVLFLLGAFGLSLVLGLIVWLVSRPRKPKFGATIDTFANDLSALAPDPNAVHGNDRQAAVERPRPGPRPRS